MQTRRDFFSQLLAAGPSLQQVSELIRKKSASPVELTQECLKRIEKLNPSLNAYITVMGEQALAQARELEAERQRGKWRGPLHGVPIGLKDLIDTAGVRTTAASAIFANRVPTEDAEVVQRLKAAGAVLVGKLNMHEFAYGATSVPSHYGPVHNPWNLDRIAGGSSGGSAAAVAAELCYGALGSDTGGSIRQPSAYCGIVGLKPTYGRVSTRGVIPLSWSLDHIGPMCRTVADAALLLGAIAGYDPREATSVDVPVPDYTHALRTKVTGLRLGIPRAIFFDQLDPEIAAAVDKAIDVLGKLTSGVQDVRLPAYENPPVLAAEAYAYHIPYFSKTPELYQPFTRARIESGAKISAASYIQGRRELDRLRRAVEETFATVDLLITPTTPVPPATIEDAKLDTPPAATSRPRFATQRPSIFTACPRFRFLVALPVPALPIGIQISGPHFGRASGPGASARL